MILHGTRSILLNKAHKTVASLQPQVLAHHHHRNLHPSAAPRISTSRVRSSEIMADVGDELMDLQMASGPVLELGEEEV